MCGAQRAGGIGTVHRHRDVAFGRTLRDRQDVHLRTAQRLEQARRHTGLAGHAVTDRGQHADPLADLHALHLAHRQLMREHMQQGVATARSFGGTHHAAD
ncbi:hypothetical protein G6F35_017697 [Rhizopus arrhizus]|nr:hypothetical protein G6F35_017697 [Rhizopus arrhizus]